MTTTVKMRLLPHGVDLPAPQYRDGVNAGLNLFAAVSEPKIIKPGERAAIPTGLVIGLPPGTEAQVRPRAGLALCHGVTVLNAPGTFDASYHGEIQVVLINLGEQPFTIERGTCIALLAIAPVLNVECEWPLPAEWP
jgi:dUTP pyrophosphatase